MALTVGFIVTCPRSEDDVHDQLRHDGRISRGAENDALDDLGGFDLAHVMDFTPAWSAANSEAVNGCPVAGLVVQTFHLDS